MKSKAEINKLLKVKMKSMHLSNNRIFNEERKTLLREYKTALDNINKRLEGIDTFENLETRRLKSIRAFINNEFSELNSASSTDTKNLLTKVFKNSYIGTGKGVENSTGTILGFGIVRKESVLAAIRNPLDNIGWLRRNTANNANIKKRIRSEITQAVIQGKSITDVSKRIKRLVDIAGYKATRIARTETRRVQSKGTIDAQKEVNRLGKKFGIETKRFWISTKDSRTRDLHEELNGVKEDEEGFFNTNGYTVEAPAMFGIPEQDINCRCTVGMEVDTLSDKKTEDITPEEPEKEEIKKQEVAEPIGDILSDEELIKNEKIMMDNYPPEHFDSYTEEVSNLRESWLEYVKEEEIDVDMSVLTKPEQNSILLYTDNKYIGLNSALQQDGGIDSIKDIEQRNFYKAFNANLKSALDKLPEYLGGDVVRVVNFDGVEDIVKSWDVGSELNFKAFSSTSEDIKSLEGIVKEEKGYNVKMFIKGNRGKSISGYSTYVEENEVLFKSNSNFKINRKEKSGNVFTFYLEEI